MKIILALLSMIFIVVLSIYTSVYIVIGDTDAPKDNLKVINSDHWNGKGFENIDEMKEDDSSSIERLYHLLFNNKEVRTPEESIDYGIRNGKDLVALPSSGLRVTWFGHSNVLLEFKKSRVLIDPTWSERASPFKALGPKRFYSPSMRLDALPPVDLIVISHDHYDHLDYEVANYFRSKKTKWVVPLGIKSILMKWGVPEAQVIEFDWWEEKVIDGVFIASTPARHYSGRLSRSNHTLWSSWVIKDSDNSIFYSGDTGMHREFNTIGEKYGPFDLTLMEAGSYSAMWHDTHLGPEQAVIAHKILRGKYLLPVHWAAYNMAPHGWSEPIERVINAANKLNVKILTPQPGTTIDKADFDKHGFVWPIKKNENKEYEPVWSSKVSDLLMADKKVLNRDALK
ncbi:MBL fold metallo-hydrolase [Aeromonas veronii]|uniref:MBL fold metallo-hydrolase n=1 Tax=Aeromonas veronii TaxID=654 RepID=UPI001F4459AE|nr:MBL fold metallo-hydrolase [Aeromonas veronii]MCF5760063.1 MBL fold metallo-hydrolase [Aeromonas veronii]